MKKSEKEFKGIRKKEFKEIRIKNELVFYDRNIFIRDRSNLSGTLSKNSITFCNSLSK
jgi:hypothetical protein